MEGDVEEVSGFDRGTLLRRIALGGAAMSLPALGTAEAAFGASPEAAIAWRLARTDRPVGVLYTVALWRGGTYQRNVPTRSTTR